MHNNQQNSWLFIAIFAIAMMAATAQAQAPVIEDISISDQKAGSLLVFPFYTSNVQTKADTRLTISNIGRYEAAVHLMFMDRSCSQADTYLCLTPNASLAIKASEYDPEVYGGWLLAIGVDRLGNPYNYNSLIGNAFVVDGDYVGNYGAEAIRDFSVQNTGNNTATVSFPAPNAFTAEIQSPVDVVGQKIVTVGLQGNVINSSLTGAGQVGVGQVFNGNEKPFGSFSRLMSDGCRSDVIITGSFPRVPMGMAAIIPSGHVGTIKWNAGPSVGLLMTPKNNRWFGIRPLHKTSQVVTSITLPSFYPGCGISSL